ncbi:putative WD40 repeat, subgroup, WD40/YVTN repeat-like-containing domain protein [Pseudoloma neurophilia]|uniref:Putative WD40 repeat, subgroup, WD40/YVTN repeat-like-containing domain protein n=1 Tax=Pseudoloma neurophilia TaxID=146866 RepID=A0A0R0M5G5_9MICR|nr:putative WD40 repeat, subgroup, WD40/YVTN repeat-like-containing domain protein [Pseudoloma neurophilia]
MTSTEEKSYSFETTRHTLHFHEDASIYSITQTNKHLVTSGTDKSVRFWHINLKDKKTENVFCSPETTSVDIKYCTSIEMLNSVNIVKANDAFVVFGSIEGEISAIKELGCKFESSLAKGSDGDSCNDICFIAQNAFVAAFESGKILIFEITENPDYMESSLQDEKIDTATEQSFDVNENKGLNVAEMSLHSINESEIAKNNSNLENNIDTSDIEKPKRKRIVLKIVQKPLIFKVLYTAKPHYQAIQGLAFNPYTRYLASFSKDRSAKIFYVTKKLNLLDRVSKIFADEQEMILFMKFSFSTNGKFLFLGGCNGKVMNILHEPFGKDEIFGSIGPFDGHVSVIYEFGTRKIVQTDKLDVIPLQHSNEIKEKFLAKKVQKTESESQKSNALDDKPDQTTIPMVTENKEEFIHKEDDLLSVDLPLSDVCIFPVSNTPEPKNSQPTADSSENQDSFQVLSQPNDVMKQSGISIENIDDLIFFAIRNDLYCMDRKKIIVKFENIAFKGITDICVHQNVIFISSVDGLLSSVRFVV